VAEKTLFHSGKVGKASSFGETKGIWQYRKLREKFRFKWVCVFYPASSVGWEPSISKQKIEEISLTQH